MRLVTFRHHGTLRLGVDTPRGIFDVYAASEARGLQPNLGDPTTFFRIGSPALDTLAELFGQVDEAQWIVQDAALGPCVPSPEKIICIGLNYRRHAAEAKMVIPEKPLLFSKFNNALAATGDAVPIPPDAAECDYEAELVVVIGREARSITPDQAIDHILGYCNGNDLTARDLQFRTSQWLLGKTPDSFMPIGPYLVTASEIPDPQDLPVRLWLNGELRQDSNTSDMVFPIAAIIAYLSRTITLRPGDLICTGTPAGVIMGQTNPRWLQPGDEVVVEIGPLGRLVNVLRDA